MPVRKYGLGFSVITICVFYLGNCIWGTSGIVSAKAGYTYDELGRLTEEGHTQRYIHQKPSKINNIGQYSNLP